MLIKSGIAFTRPGQLSLIGIESKLKEPHFLEDTTTNTVRIASCINSYNNDRQRLVFVLITETNAHLDASTFTITSQIEVGASISNTDSSLASMNCQTI